MCGSIDTSPSRGLSRAPCVPCALHPVLCAVAVRCLRDPTSCRLCHAALSWHQLERLLEASRCSRREHDVPAWWLWNHMPRALALAACGCHVGNPSALAACNTNSLRFSRGRCSGRALFSVTGPWQRGEGEPRQDLGSTRDAAMTEERWLPLQPFSAWRGLPCVHCCWATSFRTSEHRPCAEQLAL